MREIVAFYDTSVDKACTLTTHLKLKKGDVSRYVLLPGDPKRCGKIAEHFDSPKLVADNREFVTITGTYKGVEVSVVSTGIGGPSSAIALDELTSIGADTFVRVGTSGALSLGVNTGDLIIAQAAIKDEGTSKEFLPLEYPALAHPDLINALLESAEQKNYACHVGIVHSKDSFYGEVEPQNALFRERFEKNLMIYTKLGALCSEMESAALFCLGHLKKVRVSSIMLAIEHSMKKHLGGFIEHNHDLNNIIQTSLDAIVLLNTQDTLSDKKAKDATHE